MEYGRRKQKEKKQTKEATYSDNLELRLCRLGKHSTAKRGGTYSFR
jgi:hypothetical protein